jgi:hypothetical protein
MSCRFEPEILHAVKEDRWTDALRRHLAECDECVAAVSVAPWMTRFSRISDREHRLPDPQLVWLKARLLQGSADVARVSRPMNVVQIVAYLVVAGGWAALLTWKWAAVATWLRGFTPIGMMHNVTRGESLSLSFFAFVFVLASMTVMLALHTIMAED